MNSYEEELQKNIEAGQNPNGDDHDIKAYREVFQALKQAPGFEVSPGFADRVMLKAEEMRKNDSSRDIFWLGTGIFLIVIALIVAIMFTGFKPSAGFLSNMSDYKGLVIFGAAFIIFLNWLDKRLIRGKQINI